METIIQSIIRTIFVYFLVLVLVRILGRKAISRLTFFDFIIAITLGTITANLMIGTNQSLHGLITVLLTLSALVLLSGYLHIKSLSARKLINSEPVILVKNGKIVDGNLRKNRIGIDDLLSLLREKNVFNISDVEFAIMENNGKLSVLKKSQKQTVTPSDLNLPTAYIGLNKDLVIDGEIMKENLQDIHLDEGWLHSKIKSQGIEDIRDVFYAGLDTSGNLYISIKNQKNVEKHGQYGIE